MNDQLRLLRYVIPHWRQLAIVLLMIGINVGLNVLRPWPTKLLVDQVFGHHALPLWLGQVATMLPGPTGARGLLLWVSISTVLIFVIGTAVGMVRALASTAFSQRITYDLAADMFSHLQRLSLLFHSRRPVGDTISRVTGDSYCVQNLVQSAVLPLLQSLITLVAIFAIMWAMNPQLTLLSLAIVPFLFVTAKYVSRPMKRATRERRDIEGEMTSVVQQTLTAVPAVQAFTREDIESSRFRDYTRAATLAYLKATWASNWFSLFSGLATATGTAALMYIGGTYVLDGRLSVGSLLVFIAYLASLYGPLSDMTYIGQTLQVAAAQADRVFEILDAPLDVDDSPTARPREVRGHIRYDDVAFGYAAGRPVLEHVSLEAHPGETLAIVGPTGAGKTTLVSLLIRFFDPWSGTIEVDGVNIKDITLESLRHQVAIVLQEPFIFPTTIAENIAYGRPEAGREEIVAAARAASADDFIRRLPDGYDTLVGERGATLSGGEKQRLSIARAFLKDAPILILDEPTSALDARTESQLIEALERLMEGRTALIIAHRLSTIRHASEIVVVNHGEIVERGSHAELIEAEGLYSSLYVHQMDIVRHDQAKVDVPRAGTPTR